MDAAKSPWNKFTEWWTSHALWEASRAVVGAAICSFAGTRLLNAAAKTGENLFLFFVGVLVVAWGVGILPVRKNKSAQFPANLAQKCDDVILKWKVLAEDYGRNPDKSVGQTATVPYPMDPAWPTYGFKDWHYRVGFLQGMTYSLLWDLASAGIQTEQWDPTRLSMAELLHVLGKYQMAIETRMPSLS
jgi:hypothetical protein